MCNSFCVYLSLYHCSACLCMHSAGATSQPRSAKQAVLGSNTTDSSGYASQGSQATQHALADRLADSSSKPALPAQQDNLVSKAVNKLLPGSVVSRLGGGEGATAKGRAGGQAPSHKDAHYGGVQDRDRQKKTASPGKPFKLSNCLKACFGLCTCFAQRSPVWCCARSACNHAGFESAGSLMRCACCSTFLVLPAMHALPALHNSCLLYCSTSQWSERADQTVTLLSSWLLLITALLCCNDSNVAYIAVPVSLVWTAYRSDVLCFAGRNYRHLS